MNWFAFQRGMRGELVPVTFNEHPKHTPSMCGDLIWATLRPIPTELQNASLAELVVWSEPAQ